MSERIRFYLDENVDPVIAVALRRCKRSPPSFHAPRGMLLPDAPRRVDAERPGGHSHVERGNETGE